MTKAPTPSAARHGYSLFGLILLWISAVILTGCGGAKPAPLSGFTPLPSVNVLVIVPEITSILTSSTQQFTAMVNNSAVQSVQWEVNDIPGGDGTVGTINASGMYTAPSFVPTNPKIKITAVANADNTRSGSATVTITGAEGPATINISPQKAFLQIGKTLTLTATVTGVTNKSVTWVVSNGTEKVEGGNATLGTIRSTSGVTAVYTAPATVPTPSTVTILAVSNEAPLSPVPGVADVTITKNPPDIAIVSIAPSLAFVQAGHSFPFTASVTGISDTSVTWSVCSASNCPPNKRTPGGDAADGTITTNGVYTAPTQVSASKTVYVVAASTSQPTSFATAAVTVTPLSSTGVNIAITPASAEVETGGNTRFTATVSLGLSGLTDTSVTWYVNDVLNGNATVGTLTAVPEQLNQVEYDAPAQVPAANPVIIKAIPNADKSIAATASVDILKPAPITVMVTPSKTQVQISTQQQFVAQVQNAQDQSVIWQLVPSSGCSGLVGSIDSIGGLYTAPTTLPPANCTVVVVTATSNQDGKTKGTATITIVSALSVVITLSPLDPTVQVNTSQQFTATITNTTDTTVSDWQVNGISGGDASSVGTISMEDFDTALYTAPATVPSPDGSGNGHVTVTAVSDADQTKTVSTTVTITPAPPPITVTVQPSGPVPVLPGQSQQFTAHVNGTSDQVVFWFLSGVPGGCATQPQLCGTITAKTNGGPATYTAPSSVNGNLTITITAVADADSSAHGTSSVVVSQSTAVSISISPGNPSPIEAGSASPLTFNAIIGNAPPDTPVSWQMGCISLDSSLGSTEACGFSSSFDHGGPGCTSIDGSTPLCSTAGATQGPGNDPLIYTAPGILYTNGFLSNVCEETNDGSGNGQVPLTALVSFNGSSTSATVCITVTP